jgi:hypothetical protein
MVGYSFYLMLVATAVKPEVPMNIDRPFDILKIAFFTGELALNTQGIDMPLNPGISAARQSWNLGQKLGLEGLVSLTPPLINLMVLAGWLIYLIARQREANPPK